MTEIALAAKRHWGYDEQLINLWADELTITADFIASHPVYCAVCDDEILGFYALTGEGDEYELEHIWVDPSCIGVGFGQTLFEHAVRKVAQLGGTVLRIVADPHAEGFYLRMGAVPVGNVPSRPEGRMLPVFEVAVGSKLNRDESDS